MLTETNAVKKDEKQYNPLAFLNLVRLILALSIVLWHFPYGYSEYNGLFPDSFFAGWRDIVRYGGNQAFLVISGMLFYHSYYQRLDQKGPGGGIYSELPVEKNRENLSHSHPYLPCLLSDSSCRSSYLCS